MIQDLVKTLESWKSPYPEPKMSLWSARGCGASDVYETAGMLVMLQEIYNPIDHNVVCDPFQVIFG